MFVTCRWKKLQKQRLYEKRARIKLMKLTAGESIVGEIEQQFFVKRCVLAAFCLNE
jgi:hypothetical protein